MRHGAACDEIAVSAGECKGTRLYLVTRHDRHGILERGMMAANTPDWKAEGELKTRASRYVNMDALPWRPTAFPGSAYFRENLRMAFLYVTEIA